MDYSEALQKALEAANAQTAQQSIAANIAEGNNAYNQIAENAALTRKLEAQRLAQRLSDMGASPSSLTTQNNSVLAGYKNAGAINSQNQAYTAAQNAMITQANANAAAQSASITANMNAAQNASNITEMQSKYDRYYDLYTNKKMTANQFKKLTGIDVKSWATYTEPADPSDWFTTGTNSHTQSYESGFFPNVADNTVYAYKE